MALAIQLNGFSEHLGRAVHNLASDQLMVALSNVAPAAEDTPPNVLTANCFLTNVSQIANIGNAAGLDVNTVSFDQVGGVADLAISAISVTASAGTVGPFRYIYLYNSTAAGDPLVTCHDNLQEVTLLQGQVFSASMDNVDGNLVSVRFV